MGEIGVGGGPSPYPCGYRIRYIIDFIFNTSCLTMARGGWVREGGVCDVCCVVARFVCYWFDGSGWKVDDGTVKGNGRVTVNY